MTWIGADGSSPRVQGTGLGIAGVIWFRRFIPARAGNGFQDPNSKVRVCGSSPRVQGTGNDWAALPRSMPVHPRACRERKMGSWRIAIEAFPRAHKMRVIKVGLRRNGKDESFYLGLRG